MSIITFAFLENQVGTSFVSELLKFNQKNVVVNYYNLSDVTDNTSLSALISSWVEKAKENDFLVLYRSGYMEESDLPFKEKNFDIVVGLSNKLSEFHYMVLSCGIKNLPKFTSVDALLENAKNSELSIMEKDSVIVDNYTGIALKKVVSTS